MKVVSVNIAKRQRILWQGRSIETGIYKYPVDEPIFLEEEQVRNDCIADRKHHGGKLQAVYAYSAKHYKVFKPKYPKLNWGFGMFGENLTMSSLDETKINVGNIYKLGSAKIEATKPRQPCYKLGVRFEDQSIVEQVWNSTKSGIYFKILKPGWVSKYDELNFLKEKTQ